jgi:hypothetical protein
MGFIASFDPVYWPARYPEFAGITTTTAPGYFLEAGLYLNNTGSSPVQDAPTQSLLMHMLTAHIAELYDATSQRGSQALVGRITDASEGTVKVAASMDDSDRDAWLNQTKYGASFLRATRKYRRFSYRAPCPKAPIYYPTSGN